MSDEEKMHPRVRELTRDSPIMSNDTRFAIYRRETRVRPHPSARYSVDTEFLIGIRDTWDEAEDFADATSDPRVFVREIPKSHG